jgi:serine/threonine-protein kinase
MGSIYKSWDTRLNRPVALKEMIPQPGLDAEMLSQLREQFENEAQILATLNHPNLVRVTDYFTWDGNEYLVMDFVEGESLADRIDRIGSQNEDQVLDWAGQLLDTLAYCHRKGVLHRDIKPQNIIITPDGNAVLVDFGLVKLWDPDAPETRTVMRGAGTPEYAPPEQYDLGAGHTDPRTDIYSLGATLYQAFTGCRPPTATQRMADPTKFIPPRQINVNLSPKTENAILKAMEVAMSRRFQNAQEMAQAMGISLQRRPTTRPKARTDSGTVVLPDKPERKKRSAEQRPSTRPPAEKSKPKRRMGLWLVIAGAAILCLGTIGGCLALSMLPGGTGTPTAEVSGPTSTARAGDVTVAPTLTSRPTSPPETATPTMLEVEGGDVVLEDDFSDPNSGWEIEEFTDGRVGYTDGVYSILGEGEDRAVWGNIEQEFSDVIVDVDTTQISAPANDNNGYGVTCRQQSNGDGYLLRISGDGFYAIHRILNGEFTPLVEWASSDVIRQGNASNHIRAICNGSQLTLIVNGQELAQTTDSTFQSGEIGLTATSFEAEPTEIHFDNAQVARPGAPAPTGEVLFQDDFSDPNSGWDDWETDNGSVAGYKDGHYYVQTNTTVWMWGRSNHHFTDVVIDVDARQVAAPSNNNNGYGVICRVQSNDWGDGYGLVIAGDGNYSIQKIIEGDWEPIIDWTYSDVINQGNASNDIRAVCDGSRLVLIVNGEIVAQAEDDEFPSGDVSLVGTTFEEGELTEIHFDDLVVTRPTR